MRTSLITFILLLLALRPAAQSPLSITGIMADPKISVGATPSAPFWSDDGATLYFYWNIGEQNDAELYSCQPASDPVPRRVSDSLRRVLPATSDVYNPARTHRAYVKNGDLFLLSLDGGAPTQLTNTAETESAPRFNMAGDRLIFRRGRNLFAVQLQSGAVEQLTRFSEGSAKAPANLSAQDQWLRDDQLALFDVLRERSQKEKERDKRREADKPKRPKEIFLDEKNLVEIALSPDERYAVYRLSASPKGAKIAQMPNYVTESGYTESSATRAKVGAPQFESELWVYDRQRDTAFRFGVEGLSGIADQPAYLSEYATDGASDQKGEARKVSFGQIVWAGNARHAVVMIRSMDNKDRWIARLDFEQGALQTLDRLRDEAWINWAFNDFGILDDSRTLYFLSEADGYAHLYSFDLETNERRQLTRGAFEVQRVWPDADRKIFYLITNEAHPGEKRLYSMDVKGGPRICLTPWTGAVQDMAIHSRSGRMACLFSTPTQPWELYVHNLNAPGQKPLRITDSQSPAFRSYRWREPRLVRIPARDGAQVPARLYEARSKKGGKPAVIFVHGAGYLQNAHKWWSQYFREYMFHNFLADQGYTVLDLDFRGSAGYGRDWRTAIYRNMGGPDLDDHVDAARWLVREQGVDPRRIGIYGGSYGGFITLMALFKYPGVFRAGAALRPVTDWAAYNHGYTSNILNTPITDSLAYRRSSPIYHAEGLRDHLLICHGVLDDNVHFQDVVRLAQRLIELGKDNWEVAMYPLEAHGFVEPASWADEYKRIFRLFERELKRR